MKASNIYYCGHNRLYQLLEGHADIAYKTCFITKLLGTGVEPARPCEQGILSP